MKQETARFCVSLPQDLLEELDKRIIKKGYSSRSESNKGAPNRRKMG
jgi:CopG family nickel-responsive transcriptional regulator